MSNRNRNDEFESQRGDPAQHRARGPSPFDLPKRIPVGAPGVRTGFSPPFENPIKFVRLLQAVFNLAAASGQQILPSVNQQRTFLSIRNSSTSAGILFIGFGAIPTGASDAVFELVPGGQLVLDVVVPQDAVCLFSTAGAVGVVSNALTGILQEPA